MYKPLNNYVLLEPIEKQNPFGLTVVSSERPQEMKVLAVSEKVDGVKVGDTVLVEKWAGKEIEVNGVKCYFVDEKDLLVVIETA